MKILNIKEYVGSNKKVHFVRYRRGEFIYATDNGLEFPVSIEDVGDAEF